MKGTAVMVAEDGQGHKGTVQDVVIDTNMRLWYSISRAEVDENMEQRVGPRVQLQRIDI